MSVFVSSSHLDHAVPCFYLVIKLSTVKPLGRCVNRIEVTAALGPAFSIMHRGDHSGRFWSARDSAGYC